MPHLPPVGRVELGSGVVEVVGVGRSPDPLPSGLFLQEGGRPVGAFSIPRLGANVTEFGSRLTGYDGPKCERWNPDVRAIKGK